MTGTARTRRRVAALLVAGLAGCSSPDPVLYTIAPVNGPTSGGGPRAVLLERVEIARYLDRAPIVRSSENYRIEVRSNAWWGEPLAAMLSRVLREELAQRLPRSVVVGEAGASAVTPDATVEVEIQRLDEDGAGHILLRAQVGVSPKGSRPPIVRSLVLTAPLPSADTPGEVAAASAVMGQLADAVAAMLAAAA